MWQDPSLFFALHLSTLCLFLSSLLLSFSPSSFNQVLTFFLWYTSLCNKSARKVDNGCCEQHGIDQFWDLKDVTRSVCTDVCLCVRGGCLCFYSMETRQGNHDASLPDSKCRPPTAQPSFSLVQGKCVCAYVCVGALACVSLSHMLSSRYQLRDPRQLKANAGPDAFLLPTSGY